MQLFTENIEMRNEFVKEIQFFKHTLLVIVARKFTQKTCKTEKKSNSRNDIFYFLSVYENSESGFSDLDFEIY